MTDSKKLTTGQKFLLELEAQEIDKNELLNLAYKVIKDSHTKRTLGERCLPETPTALNLRSIVAKLHALHGKDVSTDDKLIMIENAYLKHNYGSLDKFKKEFSEKYSEKF